MTKITGYLEVHKFECGPLWDTRIVNIAPTGNVGVLVSSGMDSTTLLALLAKIHPIEKIFLFNIQTGPNPIKPVIEDLISQMGLALPINIVGKSRWEIPMYNHHARIFLAMDEIRKEWPIDQLYCGNIQSPREEFFPRFDIHSPEFPKRPWRTDDPFLKNPFEHLEKYHIIDLGRRLGIDYLYKTTISCNRYELWHCWECMGCDELVWAYSQLETGGTSLDDLVQRANYDLTHDDTRKHDAEYWANRNSHSNTRGVRIDSGRDEFL